MLSRFEDMFERENENPALQTSTGFYPKAAENRFYSAT